MLDEAEKSKLAVKASEDRHKARALKEEAKALDAAAKEAEDQVAKGMAKRVVEVVEVKNFANNEVTVERCDEARYWPETGKVVSSRPITGEERQTQIDVTTGEKKTTKRGKKGSAEDLN